MTSVVLDTSALMALLSSEPGADQVVLLFCLASQISSSGMSASAATVETAWDAFSRTAGGSTVGGGDDRPLL